MNLRFLLVSFFMAANVCSTLAEPMSRLIIWAKDGTKEAYDFAEKPIVKFNNGLLSLCTENMEIYYDLSRMQRITYELADPSGISDIQTDEPFGLHDGALVFPSLAEGSTVSVYTIGGRLELSRTVSRTGEYALPMSSLAAGVYVVSVNGHTYKVVKR